MFSHLLVQIAHDTCIYNDIHMYCNTTYCTSLECITAFNAFLALRSRCIPSAMHSVMDDQRAAAVWRVSQGLTYDARPGTHARDLHAESRARFTVSPAHAH